MQKRQINPWTWQDQRGFSVESPSVMDEAHIRPAASRDVPAVKSLMDAVSSWLIPRGIYQWDHGYMPVETLRERAKRGELYLCERDGEVVGTVALKDSEPELWGEDEGDCLYLHTLAVRPDLRGTGLARWMLNWVETFAGERHRSRVRLDCLAELDSLRRYYREAGYTELGIKRMNETWVAALFEKELGR